MRGDEWLLFGHLIGVIALFGAVAIENATLISVLRARTVDDLRGATTFVPLLSRLFPIAVVLILGFGIGLVAHSHEFKFGQAWIDVGLGLLIVLTIVGPTVQGRRFDHIATEVRATPSGRLPDDLHAKAHDPVLRTSVVVSSWLAIGIVLLMTRKPDWTGAWLTAVVFALIGVGESMMLSRLGEVAEERAAVR